MSQAIPPRVVLTKLFDELNQIFDQIGAGDINDHPMQALGFEKGVAYFLAEADERMVQADKAAVTAELSDARKLLTGAAYCLISAMHFLTREDVIEKYKATRRVAEVVCGRASMDTLNEKEQEAAREEIAENIKAHSGKTFEEIVNLVATEMAENESNSLSSETHALVQTAIVGCGSHLCKMCADTTPHQRMEILHKKLAEQLKALGMEGSITVTRMDRDQAEKLQALMDEGREREAKEIIETMQDTLVFDTTSPSGSKTIH